MSIRQYEDVEHEKKEVFIAPIYCLMRPYEGTNILFNDSI